MGKPGIRGAKSSYDPITLATGCEKSERIRWNTLRIFLGRGQSKFLVIVRRSKTVNVG
jgi:hypothetical protein